MSIHSVNSEDSMNEIASMDIQTPKWSANEMELLRYHLEYHSSMVEAIKDMTESGNRDKQFPSKPREPLSLLLNNRAKQSKRMTLDELDAYLRGYEAVDYDNTNWTSQHTRDIDSIIVSLRTGFNFIKFMNNKCVNLYLQYGEQLNLAYTIFLRSRTRGCTWKNWLKINVGIDDSYARKLRKVAKELCHYPRFKRLHVPFQELYKHINNISLMLLDSDVHNYWVQ